MSFILDALKKSENERQRHQGPSLVDVPARRTQSERPLWVFALAGLLILNLVVFLIVLLRKNDAPTTHEPVQSAPAVATPAPAPPAAAAPVTPPASPIVPAQPQPTRGDPTVRSLAEEAGVEEVEEPGVPAEPDVADAANVPAGPRIVSPITGPSSTPVRSPPTSAEHHPDEILPTINDLTANGNAQFPPVHLDIHVYATRPADRFVFINMKKYREGESTAEGLYVEQIRRDGVVLNHQGVRFVLPRQ